MDLDKEQNRPKAPTGAGEVPVPQEEPQKLGKPLETPRPAKDFQKHLRSAHRDPPFSRHLFVFANEAWDSIVLHRVGYLRVFRSTRL